MADTGAHLVDQVLPVAPYRQWTLSLPWRLRPRLAHDRRLLTRALAAFTAAIFRWQRARARALGIARPAPAAVTSVQRFGSALDLDVHVHTLVPDGVFVADGPDAARLVPLPPPTDDDAAAVCARAARRIRRLLDDDEIDHITGAEIDDHRYLFAFLGAAEKGARFSDFAHVARWIDDGAPGARLKPRAEAKSPPPAVRRRAARHARRR